MSRRNTITDNEKRTILLASSLFTMMYPQLEIASTKRIMKKLTRSMKNMLATYRTTIDTGLYLKLVNDSIDITITASKNAKLRKKQLVPFNIVNSGSLFRILYFKYPELFNTLGVDYKDVMELISVNKEDHLLLPTLTFTNRLLAEIDNYINLDYEDIRTDEDIVADINKKTGKTSIMLKQRILNKPDVKHNILNTYASISA